MSDLGFKGTYAHSNNSPIESAGAPATNLSDTKLDILMGMFVKFQEVGSRYSSRFYGRFNWAIIGESIRAFKSKI